MQIKKYFIILFDKGGIKIIPCLHDTNTQDLSKKLNIFILANSSKLKVCELCAVEVKRIFFEESKGVM